jgi:2,4-diketo-3-deoxy-L-fuconate hydrolase
VTRFVTYSDGGDPRLGVVKDGLVVDVQRASGGALPRDLPSLIGAGEAVWEAAGALSADAVPSPGIEDVARLLPPLMPRKNVFAVGRNYRAHIAEGAAARDEEAELPRVPVFFTKPPTSVIGHGDEIPWQPEVTTRLDWEAELAVVIGRGGRDIPPDEALRHVFGYTAANDVSARDLQRSHGQWFKGKGLDGSCPLGPVVVTGDELGDPGQLGIWCRVNGVVKQEASTAQMIFSIDTIIAALSAGLTLEPGDVILTGTPEGVGFARTPPEFLGPGDVVEVEISQIGTLRNHVALGTSGR